MKSLPKVVGATSPKPTVVKVVIFTEVRGIGILRSSRVTHSRNFPLIAFSDVPGHKGTERGPRHATPALFWLPVTEVAALSDAHTFAEWHHADGKG